MCTLLHTGILQTATCSYESVSITGVFKIHFCLFYRLLFLCFIVIFHSIMFSMVRLFQHRNVWRKMTLNTDVKMTKGLHVVIHESRLIHVSPGIRRHFLALVSRAEIPVGMQENSYYSHQSCTNFTIFRRSIQDWWPERLFTGLGLLFCFHMKQ